MVYMSFPLSALNCYHARTLSWGTYCISVVNGVISLLFGAQLYYYYDDDDDDDDDDNNNNQFILITAGVKE